MEERGEMILVEIKPGDVRRVNPKDKDTFMAANPGAKIVSDGASADEDASNDETKAQKPASNKARSKASDK